MMIDLVPKADNPGSGTIRQRIVYGKRFATRAHERQCRIESIFRHTCSEEFCVFRDSSIQTVQSRSVQPKADVQKSFSVLIHKDLEDNSACICRNERECSSQVSLCALTMRFQYAINLLNVFFASHQPIPQVVDQSSAINLTALVPSRFQRKAFLAIALSQIRVCVIAPFA